MKASKSLFNEQIKTIPTAATNFLIQEVARVSGKSVQSDEIKQLVNDPKQLIEKMRSLNLINDESELSSIRVVYKKGILRIQLF